MKKIMIIFIVMIIAVGTFAASDSYSPRWKAVVNNGCPTNYTKKFIGNRVRCFENCKPGYRFKVKSQETNTGGIVSYMECVR